MARIIHVEDEPAWLAFTRDALAEHHVDSASSFREAVSLIQGSAPYALALVDLNLDGDGDDRLGGEILDLLRMDYPSTRRIVVTGRPPVGGLRVNIFERYGVEEIIIKGRTTLPDLRKIVTDALSRDAAVEIPPDVKVRKSELTQRYRDWHGDQERVLRAKVREAKESAHNAGRLGGEPARLLAGRLKAWLALQEQFQQGCAELDSALSSVRDADDVASASGQFDRLAAGLASGMTAIQAPDGAGA